MSSPKTIREPFPLQVSEAYDRWLFHGPGFQVIDSLLGMDASGMVATITPSRAGNGAPWLANPFVLDAGPQMAILWSRARFDTTPLPTRIAAYHRYGPIGSEPLEVRFEVAPGAEASAIKADVWFVRAGRVLGKMEGLEGAGSAERKRITGVLTK